MQGKHALLGFRGLRLQALSEQHHSLLGPWTKTGFQEEK
jgi:hypothetical protein